MLEQFEISEDEIVRVPADAMRRTVEGIFCALGFSDEDARQSADVLIYADLRGYDTHGVSNMLRIYVDWVKTGATDPKGEWKIVRDGRAACTIDSGGAHGGVVGPAAMRLAIERAKAHGVGIVNVYNGGHYGAAAYTAAMALEHDMIGVSMTVGGLRMTPTFGAQELVGLNPIAIAVPSVEQPPFVFDASMSAVAGNKIRIANRLGRGTLPGWITDADGDPVMDEVPIPEGFMHLPLGATRAIGSHKGYGLGVMVEVLCSLLSGAGGGPHRRVRQSQQVICYDVEAFTDLALFKRDMDDYLCALRDCKPAPGHERVLYPGLNAHEVEADRSARGLVYHPEVLEWFDSITREFGVKNALENL